MAHLESHGRLVAATPRAPVLRRIAVSSRASQGVTLSMVAAATAMALWLRVTGLPGWDGTLSVDEARLALAARGILDHGGPVLPSGWIYTRGLVSAYLVASSFAILGQSDFAARLPSALAGAALVPVMYLLGRALAGRAGGLFAALFVAGYPPLVVWSRQAWLYAPYVLLHAAALLGLARAYQSGRDRDQVLAGLLVGANFFAHELGVFLLAPLAVQVAIQLRCRRGRPGGWVAPLAACALAVGAAAALWGLATSLRVDTLAGAYAEVNEYVSPRLESGPIEFYGRMLVDSRGLLLLAALLGIPLAVVWRRGEILILWLALLGPLVHAVALIPRGPQERYGLTLVVVLVALAAQSVAGWASWAVERFARWKIGPGAVAGLAMGLILVAHQDVGRGLERGALSPHEGAWLREVRSLGIGPDDLVMSDVPTVAGWYVGGLDYWVSSRQFEKYTLGTGDARRDVHTGAVLIRNQADFQRLVAQPNPGTTLWVLASGRSYQWGELVDDDLKSFLQRTATRRVSPGGTSRILRIDLP